MELARELLFFFFFRGGECQLTYPSTLSIDASPAQGDVPHNFYKYLVDRSGRAVHRFEKKENPLAFERDIVALLDRPQ